MSVQTLRFANVWSQIKQMRLKGLAYHLVLVKFKPCQVNLHSQYISLLK